ncbi:MAG: hypothetical protein APG12_01154 [Candidatus Methanofastidiosum methylothiophilum]|uniref:DUF354 domain-containing protein n=1 Tax=Candidatus Methanofastidiosum methylothiophilum TaxID=1705564 RepID=A0A150IYE1_9EURY|nr:MAG: hypothetical protein APG10_00904 [Candidatus Methanofastidiosum methylthiophilus]KYC48463.1 MAG: hypothetical protein APG11_00270 [Candidatus Methanofastidiosum methylthiophilus]KYC49905.1 MAG: hypothetical protein APG12_01154 [Candidatus Methanofastidiosum methylthiophilus]
MTKIIIDIGHPAHVHFFKNFIWEMEKRGHEILITARRKESAFELLNYYGFEFIDLGANKKGLFNKALGLVSNDIKLLKISRKFKPEILTGIGSPYIAQVSKLLGLKSVLFTDTEHASLINKLSVPFSTFVLTPSCFLKDLGSKQVRYDGYHELAYLHPNWFKEEKGFLKELGIKKNEKYFLLRSVSWQASHDVGYSGIKREDMKKIIELLNDKGRVFLSSEYQDSAFEEYTIKAHPAKIHTLMAHSSLYFGEGATMASESAILGIPSLYISPLLGTMGNFEELEKKYGLIYSFKDAASAIPYLAQLIENDKISEWKKKRERLLKDKIDVTSFMIDFFEKRLTD